VGQSDKVEGVGSPPARLGLVAEPLALEEVVGSPPARLGSCRPAEVEEAALLWMQLKSVFPEALR